MVLRAEQFDGADLPTNAGRVPKDMAGEREKQRPQDKFTRALKAGKASPDDEVQPPVKFPEGLSEEWVLNYCKKREGAFAKWFEKQNTRADEFYMMYENKMVGGGKGVFLPVSTTVIDTDVARRSAAMFGRTKVVDAIPQFFTENNERVKTVEDLVNQTVVYMTNTTEKGFDAIKTQSIEGTGFFKSFWEIYEEEEITPLYDRDIQTGDPIYSGESQKTETKGRWNWEPVPMNRMLWDPRCMSRIQESPYVRHRDYLTDEELLVMQQNGEIEGVEYILQNEETSDRENEDRERIRQKRIGENEYENAEDGTYAVDEWYADIAWRVPHKDAEGNQVVGKEEMQTGKFHWWIVNGRKVVMFEPNQLVPKRKPYGSFRYSIRPRRLLGRSALDPIAELQNYANRLMGNKQELVKKALQNPTFYERGSGIEGRKTILDEKSLIPVLDANKIKHFPVDVTAIREAKAELADVVAYMRETTASNDIAMGLGGGETATETSLLSQSSTSRFQSVVELTYHELYGALAQECFWSLKQFAQPGDLWVRDSSIDGKARKVELGELQGEYKFTPSGVSAEASKQNQLRQKTVFLERMMETHAKAPQIFVDNEGVQHKFDFIKFITEELMPLADVRNGKTYFVEAEKMLPSSDMLNLARRKMDADTGTEGNNGARQPRPAVTPERVTQLAEAGAQSPAGGPGF